MRRNELSEFAYLFRLLQESEFHEFHIDIGICIPLTVEYVCDPPAHACGEIASCLAKHHYASAGHILASMVVDTLYNRNRPTVAHSETLAYPTVDIKFACRCAI